MMHRRTFALSGFLSFAISLSVALVAVAAEPPAVDAETSISNGSLPAAETASEALVPPQRSAPTPKALVPFEPELCLEGAPSLSSDLAAFGCPYAPTCYVHSDCDTLCGGAGLGSCAPDSCCWCTAG